MDKRKARKTNIRLAILVIFVCLLGFTAFQRYSKPRNHVSTTRTAGTDLANIPDVDGACNKTGTLLNEVFTSGEIVSIKSVDNSECLLTLDDTTKLKYPSEWYADYTRTAWKEISFYYPEFDIENPAPISFISLKIPWSGSLETTMIDYFDNLEAGKSQSESSQYSIVTPIMFKEDMEMTIKDKLGDKETLQIVPKPGSLRESSVFHVFTVGGQNSVWLLTISDQGFFDEHKNTIESIVNSFSMSQ